MKEYDYITIGIIRKREIVERIEFEFQVSQKRNDSNKQSDVEAYVPDINIGNIP